jgi:hypothetical protein
MADEKGRAKGPVSNGRPITGIDHAIIGVRDLEEAAGIYRKLGFTLTPRGRHIGWGTANFCIMFPEDYVELLGIVDPAQFTNNLDRFLSMREGLMGFAFGTQDAFVAAALLRGQGIAADGPKDLSRVLELPEGAAMPRFSLVMLPPAATPGVSAFIAQHLSPQLIRRPEWLRHANGATALTALTMVVEDPPSLEDAYERLFGASACTFTDDTLAVRAGRSLLLFCRADDLPTLHPEVDHPNVPAPYIAAMTITVADLDATARYFEKAGIAYADDPAGALRVGPEHACGAIVEFKPG